MGTRLHPPMVTGRCTEAHELSAKRRILMATEELVCAASELPLGKVTGVGPWAVGNSRGNYFAVTRRCRHLYRRPRR